MTGRFRLWLDAGLSATMASPARLGLP